MSYADMLFKIYCDPLENVRKNYHINQNKTGEITFLKLQDPFFFMLITLKMKSNIVRIDSLEQLMYKM